MDTIGENHTKDVERCLQLVIGEWLKLNYNYKKHGMPSWKMLAKAVREVDGSIFDKIVKEHKKKVVLRVIL